MNGSNVAKKKKELQMIKFELIGRNINYTDKSPKIHQKFNFISRYKGG